MAKFVEVTENEYIIERHLLDIDRLAIHCDDQSVLTCVVCMIDG